MDHKNESAGDCGNEQDQVSVFSYDAATPLDSIIAHLTRECGGNVHKKGIVEATSSGYEARDMSTFHVLPSERANVGESPSSDVYGYLSNNGRVCDYGSENAADLGTNSQFISSD